MTPCLLFLPSFEKKSAPFSVNEYKAVYKKDEKGYRPYNLTSYPDFKISNEYNSSCELPVFWDTSGKMVNIDKGPGCYASDFDQYGDMEAFGVQ